MEILAPAGNKQNLISAINGGANAVYLGLTDFSARKSADNFSYEDLKFAISYAKTFNAKIYLTINTLIKNSELENFIKTVIKCYELGVDAFILQDVFLGKYLKSLIPNICLHLSTQAGVCNIYGAEMAKNYGFSRVILARETKLNDIKEISKIIETEVFVHGALCTCFSGHCYFSSFVGGNSGNRGYCKQPCRKKCSYYNKNLKLTDGYSLSLSDLNLSSELELLKDIGVTSVKIEGRMRSKEYVYYTVLYYKNCLQGNYNKELETKLYKTYNRGDFTKGLSFFQDKNLISNKIQGHKGYFVGKIKDINKGNIILDRAYKLNYQDSFKIIRNGYEIGVATTINDSISLKLVYKGNARIGDELFITKDNSLLEGIKNIKKDLLVKVYLKVGEKLKFISNGISVESDILVEKAVNQPILKEEIIKNLYKTDIYPFAPKIEFIYFDDNAFIVKSVINSLRAKLYATLFNGNYLRNVDNIVNYVDNSILTSANYPKEHSVILNKMVEISNEITNVIYFPLDYNVDPTSFINYYKNKKVYLYLPAFFTVADISIIDKYVTKFYGVYIDGYFGIEYAIKNNLNIFVGAGINVFNKIDVYYLEKIPNVKQITLSKELSNAEISGFNGNYTVLNLSSIQIMDLAYCPFNLNCNNCPYTIGVLLKDEENRRFPLLRYKGEKCYFKLYNMLDLNYNRLYHHSTIYDFSIKSTEFIYEFFNILNIEKRAKLLGNTTVGNYQKGIK
ncbi:MAG: U32 family peptidase [Clostridia bacterium]|nr:U32 family peptidase [Clostridia bacterium]